MDEQIFLILSKMIDKAIFIILICAPKMSHPIAIA